MTSYFTPPSDHLDPALFDGIELKTDVRWPLITAVTETLVKAGLNNPSNWINIWITGSGITYQWMDNHDLDVQMGIDYLNFLHYNPDYKNIPEYMMEDRINRYLRTFLWPKMANATFNGKEFNVTYFWNSGVESDITVIHPYAAYNIVDNTWIQQPPQIPPDPRTLYPEAWFNTALNDELASQRIANAYLVQSQALKAYSPGSPGAVTTQSTLNLLAAQAQTLFDDIHQGRRQAFAEGGKGYYDWNNFRWQQAKESNTLDRLTSVRKSHQEYKTAQDEKLYGTKIKSAQEALEEAMNFTFGTPYGS